MSVMRRWYAVFAICVAAWIGSSLARADVELGAIKAFKTNEVQTYDQYGKKVSKLRGNEIPNPATVLVSGYYPSRKLLLIEYELSAEYYITFVSFLSVEMHDQSRWDRIMDAAGELACLRSKRVGPGGGNPNRRFVGTKALKSPCPF